MEIKVMEPSNAPETWQLTQSFAILAYVAGANGTGWYLSWLTQDDDRRDVFIGDDSVADRHQALAKARRYLAANLL
ncbi:hypothetical protein [Streptomyces sp. st115]|uniref:hypothetical protein n=1 Tax=Streptomyces sp. st115 TaxID=1828047 RepID=UPI001180273E|nr:hypothetical protein [Streptomyces sp. st115]